jgi:hypothetical protein
MHTDLRFKVVVVALGIAAYGLAVWLIFWR